MRSSDSDLAAVQYLWRATAFQPAAASLARAAHYGDGVFETMRSVDGALPLLELHRARMWRGLRALGLDDSELYAVTHALAQLARAHAGPAVFKLIAASAALGRGYTRADQSVEWALFVGPLPPATGGLTLRLARTQLAPQPALAGLKHLNRLEQVLAANEPPGASEAHDALMYAVSAPDQILCATSGNVFAVLDGVLHTPPIGDAGVLGVMRQALLDICAQAAIPVVQSPIKWAQLQLASEVFLTNAVRGIRPVAALALESGAHIRLSDSAPVQERLQALVLARFGF